MTTPITLHHADEVDSTNEVLKGMAAHGAPAWTVVTADRQTAGRGRHGRAWVSTEGNLFLSLLLKPLRPVGEWATLSLLAGIALHESLQRRGVKNLTLKWPNDVLAGGRKLSGTLLESGQDWLVMGVGVNIAHAPASGNLLYPATSLKEQGSDLTVEQVRDGFLEAIFSLYERWETGGFSRFREVWLDKSAPKGTEMTVRAADAKITGTLQGISPSGALQLLTAQGEKDIAVGDVIAMGG